MWGLGTTGVLKLQENGPCLPVCVLGDTSFRSGAGNYLRQEHLGSR